MGCNSGFVDRWFTEQQFTGTGLIDTVELQFFVDYLESWAKLDTTLRASTKVVVLNVLKDALRDACPSPVLPTSTRSLLGLWDAAHHTSCGQDSEQDAMSASSGSTERAHTKVKTTFGSTNRDTHEQPDVDTTFPQSIRRYFGRNNHTLPTNIPNPINTLLFFPPSTPRNRPAARQTRHRGDSSHSQHGTMHEVDLSGARHTITGRGARIRLCDGFQALQLLTYMHKHTAGRSPPLQRGLFNRRVNKPHASFNFSFVELVLLGGMDPSTIFSPTSSSPPYAYVETWRDSLVILDMLAKDGSGFGLAFARLHEGVGRYLRVFPSLYDAPLEKAPPCYTSPDIALTEAFRKLAVNLKMM